MLCESATIHPDYSATGLRVESYHLLSTFNINSSTHQLWPNESNLHIRSCQIMSVDPHPPSGQEVWCGGSGPDGLRGVSPAALHDGHLGTRRSGGRGAAAEGAVAGPFAADGAVPMPAAGGVWMLVG